MIILMHDLFSPERQCERQCTGQCAGHFERLDLPDAEVSILHGLALPLAPQALFEALMAQTPWRQDEIMMFGKAVLQPRLHAWYGDANAAYTYSGLRNVPLAWTALLADIRARVEAACALEGGGFSGRASCQKTDSHFSGQRFGFNSVLLNLYRDERDSMGMHADDERELGREPVIASLSFGETRTLLMKHRTRRDLPTQKIPLEAGSVLLMRGATQHQWKHGINKQTAPCGARINLTFRTIYPG